MNVTANLKNWAASKGAAAAIWVNDSFVPCRGVEKRRLGKCRPLRGLCNLAGSGACLPLDRVALEHHSPALVLPS